MLAKLQLLLLLLAVSSVGASYWYHATNSARLEAAAANLVRCNQIAAEIVQARLAPVRARLATWSQDDLGTAVEKAASDAHLERDRILRIDPQPAKRLGKTDYLEQATEVELLHVTLRQLVDFIYNVTTSDDQLEVTTIRLRTPHDATDALPPELWLADVVLTQRIYAPASTAK
jgi:hypothetical protein